MRRAAALAAALIAGAGTAGAQRVCVEELAGTCLKYEERQAAPPAPRVVSPAETAEQALGLGPAQRAEIQAALNGLGLDAGPPDGAFGAKTRRAIAAWQQANGRSPSGFLASGDVALLAPRASAPAPQPAVTRPAPPPPAAAPAAARLAGRAVHGATRFEVTAEPGADGSAALTVRIVSPSAQDTFAQSCRAPLAGRFDCALRQPGWNRVRVEGALPEVTLRFDPRTLVQNNPNAQDSPGSISVRLE